MILTGKGTGKDSLEGNGSVDVPNGRLYNLPLLMDVLKFLKYSRPDHTSFEEIHAQFSIHGQRVALRNLELLGKHSAFLAKANSISTAPIWPSICIPVGRA